MVAVGFTESTRFPREPDVPNKFQNAVTKTYLRTAFKKLQQLQFSMRSTKYNVLFISRKSKVY